MITAVFTIIAVGLILWVLFWFIDWIPLQAPFNKLAKVVAMAMGLAIVCNAILIAFGQRGFLPKMW